MKTMFLLQLISLVAAFPQLVPTDELPSSLIQCTGYCDQIQVINITHGNLVEKISECISSLALQDTSYWGIKGKFQAMNICGIIGENTCTCPGIGDRIQSVMRGLATDRHEMCVGLCRGEKKEPTAEAFNECIKTRLNRETKLTRCFLDNEFHLYGNCDFNTMTEIDYAMMRNIQL
jgi:hypothetical protein